MRRCTTRVFPRGALIVNLVGSLVLGVVAGAVAGGAPSWLLTLIGTGLCGALTTFSTFGFETVRLIEDGALFEAAMNSLLAGRAVPRRLAGDEWRIPAAGCYRGPRRRGGDPIAAPGRGPR